MTPEEHREHQFEKRFDRIETKIDQLVSVVTTLARVEEQMAANNKRVDLLQIRIDKNEKDIDHVAEMARQNSFVAKFADKIFWLVVAGMISVGVFMLQATIASGV